MNETYPYYEVSEYPDEERSAVWTEHFYTLLRIMKDHSELTSQMVSLSRLDEVISYVAVNDVKTYGIVVGLTPSEVLEIASDSGADGIYINGVEPVS